MASLLTLAMMSRAEDVAPAQNPYTALVSRNIFGLVPVPPPAPPPEAPIDPPPKITVNGLMRLFGNTYQVLFKTPGKIKPGQPPKEESYVMGEGERNDDIEVKKIDPDSGMITFVNHGVVQECPLVAAQNTGPVAAPGTPGALGMPGGGPVPTLGPGVPGGGRFGRVPRPNKNVTSSGELGQPALPELGGGSPASANVNPNEVNAEHLSPEAQVIMIEKNRLDTQQQVDQGLLPPLPPTPLTPSDATAYDGSPLIAPDHPTPAQK